MKTKNKNAVKNLLEIRADYHKETFGKHITWESTNNGTKDVPVWKINIYEDQDDAVSFHYEIIGMIATIAMVNHWLSIETRKGRRVVRFHLY